MTDPDPNLPLPADDAAAPVEPVPASEPAPAALLPDDLRVPWTGADVLIFMIFSLGIMIVLEYALLNSAVYLGLTTPAQAPRFSSGNTVYVAVRQFLWFAMLLAFLFFTLRPRRAAPFWDTIGWRPPRTGSLSRPVFYSACVFAGALFALIIAMASNLMAPKQPLPIQQYFLDRQSIFLMAIMAVLMAPIVEETVFRGFLYPVFARRLGISGGIALTGIFFGLMHAQQLWGGWTQIALLMFVGVVFTAARARSGSVVTSYLLHFGYNAIQFVGFFLSDQFHKLPLIR